MNHATATLLHFLASNIRDNDFAPLHGYPQLCAAIPDAAALGLISHPGGAPLDRYYVRLTVRGRDIVDEMLAVGRALLEGT